MDQLMEETEQEWFEVWFDTPEYHLLYKHRDMDEAASFIRQLIFALNPEKNIKVLDLACGRGRHAVQLAGYGYTVHGLDYAPGNITYARQHHALPNITYWLHDMRELFPSQDYDLILNLFTSFGYFQQSSEHALVLKNVYDALRPDGIFVLDYFNTARVLNDMMQEEVRAIDDLVFSISRRKIGHRIQKKIIVSYPSGQKRYFEEWVEAFSWEDLIGMMEACGFNVEETFGDYQLNPFDVQLSPRMIIKARK